MNSGAQSVETKYRFARHRNTISINHLFCSRLCLQTRGPLHKDVRALACWSFQVAAAKGVRGPRITLQLVWRCGRRLGRLAFRGRWSCEVPPVLETLVHTVQAVRPPEWRKASPGPTAPSCPLPEADSAITPRSGPSPPERLHLGQPCPPPSLPSQKPQHLV